MSSVLIGQIVNVHGIKGEVKIYPYTDDVDSLAKKLKKVYLDEAMTKSYKSTCRIQKGMLLVKLSEIDTVEKAESLRKKYVYISEDDLDELEEDSYYVKDLLGLDVIDTSTNESIGKLDYVFNTGANDVYEITKPDNTKIYLPAIKQVIKKVDIKSKKIYVEIMEGLI